MKIKNTDEIKSARIKMGYSQRELSRVIGEPHSTLNDIENAKNKSVNLVILIKICKVLKIDLHQVIEIDRDFLIVDNYFYNLYKRGVV